MGFTLLLAKIAALALWLGKLAVAVFAAFWLLSTDLGCWFVEQCFDAAIALVNQVDVSGFQQSIAAWGSLPAEVINILGLLKVGTAAAMIAAAIVIRVSLQLIPFTRLGS